MLDALHNGSTKDLRKDAKPKGCSKVVGSSFRFSLLVTHPLETTRLTTHRTHSEHAWCSRQAQAAHWWHIAGQAAVFNVAPIVWTALTSDVRQRLLQHQHHQHNPDPAAAAAPASQTAQLRLAATHVHRGEREWQEGPDWLHRYVGKGQGMDAPGPPSCLLRHPGEAPSCRRGRLS